MYFPSLQVLSFLVWPTDPLPPSPQPVRLQHPYTCDKLHLRDAWRTSQPAGEVLGPLCAPRCQHLRHNTGGLDGDRVTALTARWVPPVPSSSTQSSLYRLTLDQLHGSLSYSRLGRPHAPHSSHRHVLLAQPSGHVPTHLVHHRLSGPHSAAAAFLASLLLLGRFRPTATKPSGPSLAPSPVSPPCCAPPPTGPS